jgi:hypothetical protein
MPESAATTDAPAVLKAPEGKLVLAAIHAVLKDLAKAGVGKLKTNQSQNFQYRGIDDVMDALSQSLSRNDLLILPSVLEHSLTERETRNGGRVLHAMVKVNYEFTCPLDGSTKLSGPWYAEAMDTGDKSTSKAMSIAYKYFATQAFCIPITGMEDADAQSHELVKATVPPAPAGRPRQAAAASAKPAAAPTPALPTVNALEPQTRPSGAFGYGKKFIDTPWDMMKGADLTWFLNAERTPQNVREKIVQELAWREHEQQQFETAKANEPHVELSDDIP